VLSERTIFFLRARRYGVCRDWRGGDGEWAKRLLGRSGSAAWCCFLVKCVCARTYEPLRPFPRRAPTCCATYLVQRGISP